MKHTVLLLLGALALGSAPYAHAQNIKTIAGDGTPGATGDGGAATGAKLNYPTGVAVDRAGNVYIADANNNKVRKVSTTGVITTIAGNGTSGFSGDGGAATAAQLKYPTNIAVDLSGNVYITDANNARIRKVTPAGIISTYVGDGSLGYGGDGGQATAAQLHNPRGLHMDATGNLYIAAVFSQKVRMVDPSGIIMTVAGTGTSGYAGDGGSAVSAQLKDPSGVGKDAAGNMYIADKSSHCIRKVTPTGTISTIAGNDVTADFAGDGGPATAARMKTPLTVKVDKYDNVFVLDMGNNRVRKINSSGVISTVAGATAVGSSGDGGPATAASFNFPQDIALDTLGNVYIADAGNNKIRKITYASPAGVVMPSQVGTLSVFPNPSAGAFTIRLGEAAKDVLVTITDVSGRVVERTFYEGTQNVIRYNVAERVRGQYIVTAQAGDATYVGRIELR